MKLLIAFLTNTTVGKSILTATGLLGFLQVTGDVFKNNTSFLEAILNSVPATITTLLGSIWGVVLVGKSVWNAFIDGRTKWDQFQTNKALNGIKVKTETEHLEQEEIQTESKRKTSGK